MKISVGVEDKGSPLIFTEIKKVSDSLNRAVPGLANFLAVKGDMTDHMALTILSQQIAEVLISHANLEIAYTKQMMQLMRTEDTVKFLEEEYKSLESAYKSTCDSFDRIVHDLSETPDSHVDLLNGAFDTLTEYAYDTGNAGLSTTWTFKEGDLKRGLADAMHSFNVKILNS